MSYTFEFLCKTFKTPVDPENPDFVKIIETLFEACDNGTGTAYMNEVMLSRVLKDLGDPAVEDRAYVLQMFREMDADSSGLIDVDEFRVAMAMFISRRYLITPPGKPYTTEDITENPPHTLKYLHHKFGTNVVHTDPTFSRACGKMFAYWGQNEWFMSEAQLGVAAKDLGDPSAANAAAIKTMFREMDSDGSGSLDPFEFREAMAVYINRGYVIPKVGDAGPLRRQSTT